MDGLSLTDLPGSSPAPWSDQRPRRRRGAPAAVRHRRRRRRLRALVVVVLALLVIGVAVRTAVGPISGLVAQVTEPDDFSGPGSGQAQVTVEPGDTGREIGATLAQAGVVKTAGAFSGAAASDPRAAKIVPGTYVLREQMSAKGALALLLDKGSLRSLSFTVPEGMTAAAAIDRASKATRLPLQELQAAAADPAVALPPGAQGRLEGWLFPATYDFPLDVTAPQVVAKMVARTTQALDVAGVAADQRETVLTKASLIQAEAGPSDDMPKVSRVIDNRLSSGQALQFDTTVNYATGKTGLTTTDQDRATVSPYNTYLTPGLPPGPISNPGDKAIAAALAPADGPWLYFVVVNPDTGQTKFSTSFAEHEANVKEFQAWLKANPQG